MARLLGNFRFCTVASDVERKMLAAGTPGFRQIHVIPNSIDLGQYHPPSKDRTPSSLIFAGSLCYAPNHDAMAWFLREVYPAITAKIPNVRLTITGDPGTRPLPHSSNVLLTGRVPDIRSLVAGSAVSLAPLRIGGGTRLKILESMALGTPVVTTPKGVEGLEARNGQHLLVADSPEDFARAVLRLLREPEYARQIAGNALKLLQNRYDWRAVLPRFMELVDEAASERVRFEGSPQSRDSRWDLRSCARS
jgi:glycosyltransferase involved in cell wall biosynthesis